VLALKNRVAMEFFTALKYIFLFRMFEQLALTLKTEFALKIFKPVGAPAPPASYAYGYRSMSKLNLPRISHSTFTVKMFCVFVHRLSIRFCKFCRVNKHSNIVSAPF